MKNKYHKLIITMFTVITITLSACGSTQVDYTTANKNTDEKTLTAQVSAEPDSIETDENGMKMVTYDKSVYGDYTGKMVYYFLEDKLMMSRWEISYDDEKKMKKTYQDLCSLNEKEYGKGTESEEKTSCNWSLDEKDITVGYNSGDDGCSVYILENEHEVEN